MDNKNEPIIKIDNILKTYKSRRSFFTSSSSKVVALNRINLSLFPGEIFGLVGESGSGKTTAGRLIVRLEEPQDGEIYLDGTAISSLKGKGLKDYHR